MKSAARPTLTLAFWGGGHDGLMRESTVSRNTQNTTAGNLFARRLRAIVAGPTGGFHTHSSFNLFSQFPPLPLPQ